MQKYFILPIFFILTINLFSQINIEIIENNHINKVLLVKDSISVYQSLYKYLQVYNSKGYLSAGFDSVIYNSENVKAYLKKGLQFYLSKINIITDEKIHFNTKKFENKPVNIKSIELEIEKNLIKFENSGYPFAEIKIENIVIKKNTLTIDIIIRKNNLILFDSIFFEKKVRVSPKFLQKYLNIDNKTEYSEQIFKNIDNKIDNLAFLKTNNPSEVEFHKSTADIYLYLSNQNANEISGFVGFTNANNHFSLIGQANLKLVNLMKTADIIYFNWQKTELLSQNLDFNFSVPYIFFTNLGISNELKIEKFDTSYVQILEKPIVSYYFSGMNKISTFINYERSIVFDTTTNNIDFMNVMYGFSLNIEQIKNKINPSKGYSFEFNLSSGKTTLIDSNINKINVLNIIQLFIPINHKFVLYLKNFSNIIIGNTYYNNELFNFGGSKNMRGFDENYFASTLMFLNTLEIRYLFEKKSNFFLFADYTIYEHKTKISYYWNHPFGIGAGINLATKAGIIIFTYAIGKEDNSNFFFKNSKIHFGFKTIF
jgi:hypothetical protein